MVLSRLSVCSLAGQALGIEEANYFTSVALRCLRDAYIVYVLKCWIDKDSEIKIWFPQNG